MPRWDAPTPLQTFPSVGPSGSRGAAACNVARMSPPPASRSKAPPRGSSAPDTREGGWDAEFKLVCVSGPLLHREFPLEAQAEAIIGSASGAAISLGNHPGVSKRHAALVRRGEGWAIRHLSLDHPTQLNGKELGGVERKLEAGDTLSLGPFRLLFAEAEQTVLQAARSGLSTPRTDTPTATSTPASEEDETVAEQRPQSTAGAPTRLIEQIKAPPRPPLRRAHRAPSPSESPRSGLWLGTALLLLALGAGGLYWLWAQGQGDHATRAERQAQLAIEQLRAEKWEEARKTLGEAIRASPENDGLKRLLERAEREQANAGQLGAAEANLAGDDLASALTALASVTGDSQQASKMRRLQQRVEERAAELVAQAKQAAQAGDAARAQGLLAPVVKAFPGHREATELSQRLGARPTP